MPYKSAKQRKAVFLGIKRRKGVAAAKRWYNKHRGQKHFPTARKKKRKR